MLTHYRHEISEFILTPASGGKFEVFINDKLIYSKLDTGLFPKTEEIIEIIEQLKIKD